MTRTCAVDSAPLTTSPPRVSSPSSAQCPCVSMRAGIRSSSTCQISREEPTVQTTLRPSGKFCFSKAMNAPQICCIRFLLLSVTDLTDLLPLLFLEFKSTPTAVFEESTSPTDCTLRTSCHPNSNSSCLSPASQVAHKCERLQRPMLVDRQNERKIHRVERFHSHRYRGKAKTK